MISIQVPFHAHFDLRPAVYIDGAVSPYGTPATVIVRRTVALTVFPYTNYKTGFRPVKASSGKNAAET